MHDHLPAKHLHSLHPRNLGCDSDYLRGCFVAGGRVSANPYILNEPSNIAFSGGRSSGYMLKKILDANNGLPDGSVVLFCNTGKEEEETLKFVRDCSVNWSVPIVWLEYTADGDGFRVVNFESASRNGEPFEALIRKKSYLPNPVTRFCTVEMKIRTAAKYCKYIGLDVGENDSIVGFRADEPRRVAKLADKSRAPMARAGVTKQDVVDFWNSNSFNLKLPHINGQTVHGNCDLCFLKGSQQILSLISERPSKAIWWARMESIIQSKAEGSAVTFRNDRPSYQSMVNFTQDQASLFGYDESIDCFCGENA